MTGPSAEPAAREALMSGLSHELSLMLPLVEGLSGLVMDHAVQADAAERPRILAQAQAVDDLGQRLQALVRLTHAIGEGAVAHAAVDEIMLADLATRLRAALSGQAVVPHLAAAASGDLMLFEP